MKPEKFGILFIIGLVFVLPAILSIKLSYLPDRMQPGLFATEKIFGSSVLSQEILSKKNNFAGVGLSIKNPNYHNESDLIISIKDENNLTLRNTILNGRNIEDGSFVVLKFDPIPDSKNKTYFFELSSPQSMSSDSLEVFYSNDINSEDKKLKLDAESKDVGLAYVSYYKQQNPFLAWMEIYGSVLSRMFQDTGFFIFYLLFIAGLIFMLSKIHFKKS